MKCPNCKSNIPDDSNFCPDCGTALKKSINIASPSVDINSLRSQVEHLSQNFSRGYKYYVVNYNLPQYAPNLKADTCQKIIGMKEEIIIKDKEILRKEQELEKELRQKEEQRQQTMQKAQAIVNNYRKGYDYCVKANLCHTLNSNSPLSVAEEIIRNEELIKQHDQMANTTASKSSDASSPISPSISPKKIFRFLLCILLYAVAGAVWGAVVVLALSIIRITFPYEGFMICGAAIGLIGGINVGKDELK